MGDAAGQLADGVHFLRLEQLRERALPLARALLDALFEIVVELPQLGGPLGHPLLQFGVEAFQLTGLAVQIDEDLDLGAQQFRYHGNRHIVDAAQLVAPQLIRMRHQHGRDENDGRRLKTRTLADHLGKLETVEVRHAHVDQDQRHLLLEEHLEGLARGGRFDEILADLRQNGLVAQQLRLVVVDQQDIHLVRCSHGPSSNDAATCAAPRAIARHSPASPDNPMRPPPGTFRGRPSWPWP